MWRIFLMAKTLFSHKQKTGHEANIYLLPLLQFALLRFVLHHKDTEDKDCITSHCQANNHFLCHLRSSLQYNQHDDKKQIPGDLIKGDNDD